MNANIMKTQIFHKIRYDFKGHFMFKRVRIGSKCVDIEILLNFGIYFRTFQGGF